MREIHCSILLLAVLASAICPLSEAEPPTSEFRPDVGEHDTGDAHAKRVALIDDHLRLLDQALGARLLIYKKQRAANTEADLERETERYERRLQHMEERIRGLESGEHEIFSQGGSQGELLAKVQAIRGKVKRLERAIRLDAAARPAGGVIRQSLKAGIPANDDCADATPISDGLFVGTTEGATSDGDSTCEFLATPDVWFRYSSPTGGHIAAETFDSSFDTVLSVHSGCPGTASNQIDCQNYTNGLPSVVSFEIEPGAEVLLRIGGSDGLSGEWQLNVGPAGAISGTITDAATGEPLSGFVQIYGPDGDYLADGVADISGNYLVSGLATGSYIVVGNGLESFIPELWDSLPCPNFNCEATDGTPISVTRGAVTAGIDFALDRGATVTGTVTEVETGEPLSGVSVTIWNEAGLDAGSRGTNALGEYSVPTLIAGTYFATAYEFGYVRELYDDIPCPLPLPDCDPTAGTPIIVGADAMVAGIDFAISRGGSITGVVTDEATGDPIPDVPIRVSDQDGTLRASGRTDVEGHYQVSGLIAGTYFVRTRDHFVYQDELYDDIPCPRSVCDATSGRPIMVTGDGTMEGIDFALERLGSISGTVTSSVTGDPLPFIRMEAISADGSLSAPTTTDFSGRYTITGVTSGVNYARTREFTEYHDELYDDAPCPGFSCDLTIGTPIMVSLGVDTPGIDFDLTPKAPCVASETTLCLNDDRFRVEAQWRSPDGLEGVGRGIEVTSDTAYFWFFSPENVELVVKLLDGCFDPFNAFWVFAGGLTDVEVDLTVTDTATGEVRTYRNSQGTAFQPIQDLGAFATCTAGGQGGQGDLVRETSRELQGLLAELATRADHGAAVDSTGSIGFKNPDICLPGLHALCLSGGRFEVTAAWDTGDQIGDARAVPLTGDSGYFWFFSPENIEAVVKVLDACNVDSFNNFWVFVAGLTDVRVTLRVTDTQTSESMEWINPLGTIFQPIRETDAFMSCP